MNYLDLINGILMVVVPVLIQATKVFLPRVPKGLFPVAAPLLGAGLAIVGHYAGLPGANPYLGAIAGAHGVWGREVLDQLNKAGAPAAPPAPPAA